MLQVASLLPLLGGSGPRLTAATRTTLVTDLNQPGWDQQLLAAGFDPARPTVWVAEGLLYYLQPEAAQELLRVRGSLLAALVQHYRKQSCCHDWQHLATVRSRYVACFWFSTPNSWTISCMLVQCNCKAGGPVLHM